MFRQLEANVSLHVRTPVAICKVPIHTIAWSMLGNNMFACWHVCTIPRLASSRNFISRGSSFLSDLAHSQWLGTYHSARSEGDLKL